MLLGAWSPKGQVAAAIAALITGMVVWWITPRLIEPEVRLLAIDLEKAVENRSGRPLSLPAWLEPVWNSHDAAIERFRQRLDHVNGRRRELEIQTRMAEAERQHMEAIVGSIADAVVVTDAFNEVAVINDAAAAALRVAEPDYRHHSLDKVIADPVLIKIIKDARESGNLHDRRHIEHRISVDGRIRTYDVTLTCVPNSQQEVSGVVTILRDITREKHIAEMQSDFVSSVSHELRTPLSSIKAYVEMLVDGEIEDDKTRREFYNIIQSETHRLSRLIDNILNISRIESGIVRIQREELQTAEVIRHAIDVMQPQARSKRITLAQTPSPSCAIFADRDMVFQALLNLIGNAIKYTPEDGKVAVESRLARDGRGVTIEVVDSGVGIPAESLPHLFEKFYRVHDHKKLAKGTGLGLNLVKHIVETIHHGKVAVASQVGKGSRFTMTLPIGDPAVAAAAHLEGQSA